MDMEGIKRLFEPRSIALVGVSKDPNKMSHWLIRNVARAKFPGPVYPISPSGGEVLGYRTYPSLSSLPEPVDLVLVSVASKAVRETDRIKAVLFSIRISNSSFAVSKFKP
jgi:acyl-CoA synthetase (NDP forming)